MAIYHYFLVKKETHMESVIDGIWETRQPIVTMDDYREFKRQVAKVGTIDEAKTWTCQTLQRMDI